MTASPVPARPARVPRYVPLLNPVSRRLLRAGVRLGPNVLVTVPGRKSGQPRSTPLAIVELDGRRWLWSPWGDTNWVRNLRAAGRATITVNRQTEAVAVRELDPAERLDFFRGVLLPIAQGMRFGVLFVRIVDGVDVRRPVEAAKGRVVFELLDGADDRGQ